MGICWDNGKDMETSIEGLGLRVGPVAGLRSCPPQTAPSPRAWSPRRFLARKFQAFEVFAKDFLVETEPLERLIMRNFPKSWMDNKGGDIDSKLRTLLHPISSNLRAAV